MWSMIYLGVWGLVPNKNFLKLLSEIDSESVGNFGCKNLWLKCIVLMNDCSIRIIDCSIRVY